METGPTPAPSTGAMVECAEALTALRPESASSRSAAPACALSSRRGSTGFGQEALASLPGNIGTNDVLDCNAALQQAVDAGEGRRRGGTGWRDGRGGECTRVRRRRRRRGERGESAGRRDGRGGANDVLDCRAALQ